LRRLQRLNAAEGRATTLMGSRIVKNPFGLLILLTLFATAIGLGPAAAASLERIKESGTIKLGYRADAAPHSFDNAIGEPAGYSVNLCRAVVAHLKRDLGLAEIGVDYVAVSSKDRFTAVQNGRVDLLCGATTATLSRRSLVDFSLPVFIDGAAVMTRVGGPDNFESLAGHKIGVLGATTTEALLGAVIDKFKIQAEIVTVKDHPQGLGMLEGGEISAYFSDQAILVYLAAQSAAPDSLRVGARFFSHEPYALALPRGDSEFRLAVDRALSRIYRSVTVEGIFNSAFANAKPSELLKALYIVSALPE
jgi:ABC-type amino acid transport substrate-binding protein